MIYYYSIIADFKVQLYVDAWLLPNREIKTDREQKDVQDIYM